MPTKQCQGVVDDNYPRGKKPVKDGELKIRLSMDMLAGACPEETVVNGELG